VVKAATRLLRRVVGGILIVLVGVPFWKLLTAVGSPIALEAVRLTDSYAILLLKGTLGILVLAAFAAFLVSSNAIDKPVLNLGARLTSWSDVRFAFALAALSGVLTLLLSWYIWDAQPILVDVLAQYVHARYFAAGMLAGPPGLPYEFWVSANTFVTDQGWVSQYPPAHIVALAVGFAVNAVWLVCPLLMAVAAFFTSLTADRLFPDDKAIARFGALLFAVSPLLATLAAAHMSHVTVAALLSIAGYCALRARDDNLAWAIGAGMAVGAAFATRPLPALVIGAVLLAGIWLFGNPERERPIAFLLQRIGVSFLGALPFLLATAAYNAHFFSNPFEFGYTSYLGPNHGLWYHPDPFGNVFGPLEGLAYTSSDLLALGYHLLRTPISVVVVIGVYLVLIGRMSNGARVVSAWALCLVVPYAAYWHHDLLLGPRMLSDAAPAWCLMASVAGVGLVRMVPTDKTFLSGRFSPRVFVSAVLSFSLLLGFGYLLPHDIRSYARTFAPAPAPPRPNAPTLVFVHGQWDGRTVARLLAAGMRGDSVTVALSLNSSCSMHEFADVHLQQSVPGDTANASTLSFTPGVTDGSIPRSLPSGATIWARPDEELSVSCLAQANSDRGGPIPLMPLLWQGDLPGIPGTGAMYVRDLGPTENSRLIERYPRHRVGVLLRHPDDGSPTILPYAAAMELLWDSALTEAGAS